MVYEILKSVAILINISYVIFIHSLFCAVLVTDYMSNSSFSNLENVR